MGYVGCFAVAAAELLEVVVEEEEDEDDVAPLVAGTEVVVEVGEEMDALCT